MNNSKRQLLARAAMARQSRYGGRRSRRSKFNDPVALGGASNKVIESGLIIPFNTEKHLHRISVKLTINNPDADDYLDAIITAGRHASDYSGRVLTDGVSDYTNSAGATASGVSVNCSFGINGNGSLEKFKSMIRDKGVLVTQSRYRYETTAQLGNKIEFRQYEEFGDHAFDFLDPDVDYDPHQFNDKIIDIPVGFVLNRDTTMELRIEPTETIILTFYIGSVLNVDQFLNEQARRNGGNVLVAR